MGDVCCGEVRSAPGGSNEVLVCQDIWLRLPATFGNVEALRFREGQSLQRFRSMYTLLTSAVGVT
jgi:hypothetical protein